MVNWESGERAYIMVIATLGSYMHDDMLSIVPKRLLLGDRVRGDCEVVILYVSTTLIGTQR